MTDFTLIADFGGLTFILLFKEFFLKNWDSLHTRPSYMKKKHKKIKAYRKSVQKEPSVKRCLLIPDLKPFRS